MSCTTASVLRKSGATAVLRPGAEARTPFGTPFFTLVMNPETDTGTFVKRPPTRGCGRRSELGRSFNESETRSADDDDDNIDAVVEAPTSGRAIGGGFVVGGAGYPSYFVPDVDGPGGTGSEVTAASIDGDNEEYDDCLWPDTYSIASDSDIDYILDGFVVIDMADATGSVFWNHRRRLREAGGLRASGRASFGGFVLRAARRISGQAW
ncbi:hypothetical protein GSI_00144 [Ganoderma sinense ZZ0214-1]|uniref:Uncharacterized protein n=1 Tax=Ganoderma sinense ZZ0214-1 TaxID=1077348 RepID=A0A2G8SRQ6_9APHY|nr:hypothetical protein GSI_00144 [Ganoderma sinense ZZ0214-1]